MGWRDVRLNKVAQHVFMRQEMEFQERLDGGRARYQHLVDEAGRWGLSSRSRNSTKFCGSATYWCNACDGRLRVGNLRVCLVVKSRN